MTIEEIGRAIDAKQKRMQECQDQARAHEQDARDLRAEYSTLKIESAELRQQVHNAATQSAAQQAMADANAAKLRTEESANQAEAERIEAANIRAEMTEKLKELDEVIAAKKAE